MLTPGLTTSASNTGAKSTTALSSRSQSKETESFSTLFSRSDKHDTRSVAEELKLLAGKPEPDGEDAQDGQSRIDLRSTSALTSKHSVVTLNAEFQERQQVLNGKQPVQGSSTKADAGQKTQAVSTEPNAVETLPEDGNTPSVPQKMGSDLQRATVAEPKASATSVPTGKSDQVQAKSETTASLTQPGSDWTLPAKPQPTGEAGARPNEAVVVKAETTASSSQGSDWTLPAKPQPAGDAGARLNEAVVVKSETTASSTQGSDWTLPAKPQPLGVAAANPDEAVVAQTETPVASTDGRDWTLPTKVEPKVLLGQAMQDAAAAQQPAGEAPVKGRATTVATGSRAETTVKDSDASPSAEALDVDTANGAIDAVLTLLGGNALRNPDAARAVAGERGGETSGGLIERAGQKDAAGTSEAAAVADGLDMPSDDEVVVGNDRTFRFSSTREGPASMTMTVGTAADGSTRFDTARASATGAEGVMVLDSRRFLGFNQSANGASLTSAMVSDPEWTSAMQPGASLSNAAAQSSTGKVVNTLKLQMTPIELGMVTATLRLSGEELTVHLTVETRAAHAQLTEDSSGIVDALKSQGFAVDELTVSIAPMAQSDASQPPAADLGPRGQASDRQFDGNAGRGQEQGSSQSGARDTSGRRENEPATDTGPAVAAGSTRPQQLYI